MSIPLIVPALSVAQAASSALQAWPVYETLQRLLLSLQRSIICSQVYHVLVAERDSKCLHNRVVALARLVVLQRLYELFLRLPCQRGVGRFAFAVCAMAPSAGGGLGLARLYVSSRLRGADNTEQCEKSRDQKRAFHSPAPLLSW